MHALSTPRVRFVYFMRRTDGEGPVKIGCSEYPESRVTTLAAWSPYPLSIVAMMPGDEQLERQFHTLFLAHWSHREWFHAAPEIEETIQHINAGTFDATVLPRGKRLRAANRTNFRWTLAQKLNAAMQRRIYATGFEPIPAVKIAYEAVRDQTSGDPASDEGLVRAYIRAPWEHGVLLPYAWALEAAAKLGAKHGFTVAATVRREAA